MAADNRAVAQSIMTILETEDNEKQRTHPAEAAESPVDGVKRI
jgi:hypothetical protein